MENYFVLTSIFALALKLVLFVRGRSALADACPFLGAALASLFLANLLEFSGFAYFNHHIEVALYPLTRS